jgi:alpha-glucosidase
MKDMGYDVSDYCDVDPVFGTLADFDALIARAHGLGLKVIIDQVLSHTSDQHPAFSPKAASAATIRKPTGMSGPTPCPTARRRRTGCRSSAGPAWAWDARRKQYYLHNFLASQPDLNLHNPAVQDWADRQHAVLAGPGGGRVPL